MAFDIKRNTQSLSVQSANFIAVTVSKQVKNVKYLQLTQPITLTKMANYVSLLLQQIQVKSKKENACEIK